LEQEEEEGEEEKTVSISQTMKILKILSTAFLGI
jgi:hypothetical protein